MKEQNKELEKNSSDSFKITERALKELLNIKKKNNIPDNFGFRIGIKGGGCSGFVYSLGFDAKIYPTDHILDFGDLKVIVDMKSYLFLTGAKLDYIDSNSGTGFIFDNPNVKTTCGCGSSVAK